MSKWTIFLWTLPPVVATPFVVWGFIEDPETRLTGMILLAALLGFAGVFVIPALFISHLEGRIPTFREAPRWALLLAGIGLTVSVLAIMGSIERGQPEYVWRYGEPGQVEVTRTLVCKLNSRDHECSGHRVSDGKEAPVTVRLSEEEFQSFRGDGVLYPGESGEPMPVDARVLGNRATSVGFGAQPASSVALGRIPEWLAWTGGGMGLAGFLLAAVVPRRRYYY